MAAPQPTPYDQPNSHTGLFPKKNHNEVLSLRKTEMVNKELIFKIENLPKFSSDRKETGYTINAANNVITETKKFVE